MLLHTALWLVVAYFSLIQPGKDGFRFPVPGMFQLTWILVLIAGFYFNYLLILPRVFNRIHLLKAIAGLLTAYIFFICFRYLVEEVITNWLFDSHNYPDDVSALYYAYDNLYFGSQPVILSTFFWLIIRNIRLSDQNRFIAEEQKITEIKFLKAQINPHFIFNTLNNIYSMVYFNSKNSLTAIEKLSNIMRFTTYQSQKDKIPLTDELDYIKAYVELEELRHDTKNFVQWNLQTGEGRFFIPPYMLSPFVENALKHGRISADTPIRISLQKLPDSITFSVVNTIGQQQKDRSGGIGISNVSKRLAIYYPAKHQLAIHRQGQEFTVHLQIELS